MRCTIPAPLPPHTRSTWPPGARAHQRCLFTLCTATAGRPTGAGAPRSTRASPAARPPSGTPCSRTRAAALRLGGDPSAWRGLRATPRGSLAGAAALLTCFPTASHIHGFQCEHDFSWAWWVAWQPGGGCGLSAGLPCRHRPPAGPPAAAHAWITLARCQQRSVTPERGRLCSQPLCLVAAGTGRGQCSRNPRRGSRRRRRRARCRSGVGGQQDLAAAQVAGSTPSARGQAYPLACRGPAPARERPSDAANPPHPPSRPDWGWTGTPCLRPAPALGPAVIHPQAQTHAALRSGQVAGTSRVLLLRSGAGESCLRRSLAAWRRFCCCSSVPGPGKAPGLRTCGRATSPAQQDRGGGPYLPTRSAPAGRIAATNLPTGRTAALPHECPLLSLARRPQPHHVPRPDRLPPPGVRRSSRPGAGCGACRWHRTTSCRPVRPAPGCCGALGPLLARLPLPPTSPAGPHLSLSRTALHPHLRRPPASPPTCTPRAARRASLCLQPAGHLVPGRGRGRARPQAPDERERPPPAVPFQHRAYVQCGLVGPACGACPAEQGCGRANVGGSKCRGPRAADPLGPRSPPRHCPPACPSPSATATAGAVGQGLSAQHMACSLPGPERRRPPVGCLRSARPPHTTHPTPPHPNCVRKVQRQRALQVSMGRCQGAGAAGGVSAGRRAGGLQRCRTGARAGRAGPTQPNPTWPPSHRLAACAGPTTRASPAAAGSTAASR